MLGELFMTCVSAAEKGVPVGVSHSHMSAMSSSVGSSATPRVLEREASELRKGERDPRVVHRLRRRHHIGLGPDPHSKQSFGAKSGLNKAVSQFGTRARLGNTPVPERNALSAHPNTRVPRPLVDLGSM